MERFAARIRSRRRGDSSVRVEDKGEEGDGEILEDAIDQTSNEMEHKLDEQDMEAFSEHLDDIMDIDASVTSVRASLDSTAKLTRALKDRSERSMTRKSVGVTSLKRQSMGQRREHKTDELNLDAVRGLILVGTTDSLESARSLLFSENLFSEKQERDLEIEELREMLVDAMEFSIDAVRLCFPPHRRSEVCRSGDRA